MAATFDVRENSDSTSCFVDDMHLWCTKSELHLSHGIKIREGTIADAFAVNATLM